MAPSPTPATPIVEVRHLDFRYRNDDRVALRDFNLALPHGVRCLLIGANGAGKSTLLSILAGKHMVPEDAVRVLGRPAFHDTSLVNEVSILGGPFPFDVDIAVSAVLAAQPAADPERQAELVELLGVDPTWHMHRVSDGQRKRVQLLLGLLRPSRLLLLDEVTTDLDVVARADLLKFMKRETTTRGATILYATHILDGLDAWATHMAFIDRGELKLLARLDQIKELEELREAGITSPLLRVVDRWLRDAR